MAVENILKKGVKVTLDRERTLAYPMVAVAYLAEHYGDVVEAFTVFRSALPAVGTKKMELKTIQTLGRFLTAGLLADDPTITYDEVMLMLDMENMMAAVAAASEALTAYLPKVASADAGTPPKRPK